MPTEKWCIFWFVIDTLVEVLTLVRLRCRINRNFQISLDINFTCWQIHYDFHTILLVIFLCGFLSFKSWTCTTCIWLYVLVLRAHFLFFKEMSERERWFVWQAMVENEADDTVVSNGLASVGGAGWRWSVSYGYNVNLYSYVSWKVKLCSYSEYIMHTPICIHANLYYFSSLDLFGYHFYINVTFFLL